MIKIVKIEKQPGKVYNDEPRLIEKIASHKTDARILAIRVDPERDFSLSAKCILFRVFRQFSKRLELVSYKVSAELTAKLISADSKREFAALINEHIAPVVEVIETKGPNATIQNRETCTLRKRFADFLFSQYKKEKFQQFSNDSKKVPEVKKASKSSAHKALKSLKAVKKVATK